MKSLILFLVRPFLVQRHVSSAPSSRFFSSRLQPPWLPTPQILQSHLILLLSSRSSPQIHNRFSRCRIRVEFRSNLRQ
ncbi:hypothetical protein L6452_03652 [Arctium lappa]|uniref:Uncharacterized protein n=1 Tax=Arctium lappa TaxID=4217 RepID=A0ACB9FP19_ARCLA|nr:hypothetical protein L6452_03652 [Arctium lappa]